MLLRIVLFGILFYALFKLVSVGVRFFKWYRRLQRTGAPQREEQVSEMVRDPVCGMYISGNIELSVVKDGRRFHFCSTECYQKFLSQQV